MDDLIKKQLLVIAISARPYAIAAHRSGFSVFVIDGFSDSETVEVATQTYVCPFDESGFIASKLRAILRGLELKSFVGCIFGSGFEAKPQLLDEINTLLPIIGNTSEVVAQVKNPEYFFSSLLGLRIAYPSIFHELPKNFSKKDYVRKSSGGSGGQHIQYPSDKSAFRKGDYYQTYMKGESVSVLFLATKSNKNNVNQANYSASLIGFNAQWVDATASQPFRFGGAASGVVLSQHVKNQLFEIVKKITAAFGLVGLNSLDVIIQNDEIYVLEVNPRLSATFDLYAKDWLEQFNLDLMTLHIQAGSGKNMPLDVQKKLHDAHWQVLQMPAQHSNAMAIVYAQQDLLFNEDFKWPDWTQDRPLISQLNAQNILQNKALRKVLNKLAIKVLKGNPVCTVITQKNTELTANKNNVLSAKKDLFKKLKGLTKRFNQMHVLIDNTND